MQPLFLPLSLVAGDSFDIAIRLFVDQSGNRVPPQIADGEAFVLTIDYGSGRIVATTSSIRDDRLILLTVGGQVSLARQLTPGETARLLGKSVTWSLARIPAPKVRRTYLAGPVGVIGPGVGGRGDALFDLIIDDKDIVVEIGLPDVNSYIDGREAVIRSDITLEIASDIAAAHTAISQEIADKIAVREAAIHAAVTQEISSKLDARDQAIRSDVAGAIATKLDGAFAVFNDTPAALAGIPNGWSRTARVGGKLSVYANVSGSLVDLLKPAEY
ncbi:hypothetical protein WYO_3714 [Methylobacterium sp. GXF4]|uniref:hypothetical protein n=1 Tax=Methylobacterium sp. GXF4 TaxID=1096546 RepID=UPI0002698032|nr:hypothetical protein [Methylobacterium sp. GXF4]EIZ83701.1 hypothetical protein WYO_3714 [Methylobacterium sp. GXF4]